MPRPGRSSARRRHLIQQRARLHAAMERGLRGDVARILDGVGKRAGELAAAGRLGAAIVEVGSIRNPLIMVFTRRLTAVANSFIKITFEQIALARKDASAFDIAASETAKFLKRHAAEKVDAITERTRALIAKVIADGDADGVGPGEIGRAIRERIGGDFAISRAETIARTETHTAANFGSNEAADAIGIDLVKEWGSSEDDRVRPDHADADGQQVEMDEKFEVGGTQMDFPGDPNGPPDQTINCRCACLYWPKE